MEEVTSDVAQRQGARHQPVKTLGQARSVSIRLGSVRRAVGMLPFHNVGPTPSPKANRFDSTRLAV